MVSRSSVLLLGSICLVFLAGCQVRQTEPQTEIGDALPGLTADQLKRFEDGKKVFQRLFSPQDGLGPLFNAEGCGECHESPVAGGVGDEVEIHATRFIPPSTCDPLFQEGGPVIQQRATPLLQAQGIEKEEIPPSATGQAQRTTPPGFGFGLIDAIPEASILAKEDPGDKDGDGIAGRANRFIDGRVGRFGRKAFIPTLREFNAGAFPIEQGITTPLSPVEETINGRPVPPGTDPVPDPEVSLTDIDAVTDFTRFLAPPRRKSPDSLLDRLRVKWGERVFHRIGCAKCHTRSMETGPSDVAALHRQTVFLFSDLLLHDMGPQLADICLGLATPPQFRTEMLMGLRFRTQFLHDGRAKSIREAIERHGGEAEAARKAFEALGDRRKRALLMFLESI